MAIDHSLKARTEGDFDAVPTDARTLVTQDHLFSVIEQSCVFAGAAPYLTQQQVPVVSGLSCDGYEWGNRANTNLIDAGGAAPADASAAYQASVLKGAGVTKLATVSAGGFAAGIANEEAIADAAKAAGIKVVAVFIAASGGSRSPVRAGDSPRRCLHRR